MARPARIQNNQEQVLQVTKCPAPGSRSIPRALLLMLISIHFILLVFWEKSCLNFLMLAETEEKRFS